MSLQDIGFYIYMGSIEFLLVYLFIMDKWPHLIHGKKFRKKRKHRVKSF